MKIVRDRRELLQQLPKGGVCAEIGVNEGCYSEMILKENKPFQLNLIDIWAKVETCGWSRPTDKEGAETLRAVSEKFAPEIRAGKVILHQGMSVVVLYSFQDHYFDWVYVDADHSECGVLADLTAAEKKIKPNGLILGHDIAMPDVVDKVRCHYPGVFHAVTEFCDVYGWRIAAVTEVHPQKRIDHATPNAQSYMLKRK